jgi:SAM-dependent methyltransferase
MSSTASAASELVTAIYDGAEGDLFELFFGEQIHIGGLAASQELAERAGIGAGLRGVDLCCCNGAGMRFLVRFRGVAGMVGVDASQKVIERGRRRCAEEGAEDAIRFVLADACANGLPDAEADFVWSEDAWCYVPDKERLIAEAVRVVKPGGVIVFTDWVEGAVALSEPEAEMFLGGMHFDNVQTIPGYRGLLEANGCEVIEASDTGRFGDYLDLYADMAEKQLTLDALKCLDFDESRLGLLVTGFRFFAKLGREGKVAQGRFIARKP